MNSMINIKDGKLAFALRIFPGILLILGWLMPITYVGLTDRPIRFGGQYMNYMWRIAALFPRRSNSWDDYFYQVRVSGSDDWLAVSHRDLGSMEPFGAGNRLHRIMAQGGGDRNREAVLRSAAWFVKHRHESLNENNSAVEEVRFLRVRYPAGSPELVDEPGPWVIPDLADVPPTKLVIWRQYRFESGEDPVPVRSLPEGVKP